MKRAHDDMSSNSSATQGEQKGEILSYSYSGNLDEWISLISQADMSRNITALDFSGTRIMSICDVKSYELPVTLLSTKLRSINIHNSNLELSMTDCIYLSRLTNLERLSVSKYIAESSLKELFNSISQLLKLSYFDLSAVTIKTPAQITDFANCIEKAGTLNNQAGPLDVVIDLKNTVESAKNRDAWQAFSAKLDKKFYALIMYGDQAIKLPDNNQREGRVIVKRAQHNVKNLGEITFAWNSLSYVSISNGAASFPTLVLENALQTREIYDQDEDMQQHLTSLRRLTIDNCCLNAYDLGAVIGRIEQRTAITSLEITKNQFDANQDFKHFSRLTNLTSLDLRENKIMGHNGSTVVSVVRALSSLKTLNISHNPVTQSIPTTNAWQADIARKQSLCKVITEYTQSL